MLYLLSVAVLLAVFSCGSVLASENTAGWTLQDAFNVKRIAGVTVSPDGSQIAFGVAQALMAGKKSEWLSQIHIAATDGRSSFQLTAGDASASSPEWSRDGKQIAFILKSGKANLWRIPATNGGKPEQLTFLEEDVRWFRWSPDGNRIAFLVQDPLTDKEKQAEKEAAEEKRDWKVASHSGRTIGLYSMRLAKEPDGIRKITRLAVQNAAGNSGRMDLGMYFDWSPDSREIAFTSQEVPGTDHWTTQRVKVVNVQTPGEPRLLTSKGNGAEAQPKFSPKGDTIALVVSDNPTTWGFTRRAHVVPANGGVPTALADTPDLQPSLVGWSQDGARVYVTETRGVTPRLLALPVNGMKPVDIGPEAMTVANPRISLTGTHVGFVSDAPDVPAEVYTAELRGNFEPVKATNLQAGLPTANLGWTEPLAWKGSEGTPIEGLITYPPGYAKAQGPVPLVVMVHGGPTEVFTRSFTGSPHVPFSPAIFASRGYAVLRPNVRGSSGYGQRFRYANMRDWGGGDFRDVLAGVNKLVRDKVADPHRLGIAGASYGGYLTAWAVTQTDRFKAASVVAGLTDLISYTGTTDVPSFTPGYLGSEFWQGARLWQKRSPISHVKRVKTPTLILQGQNDLRVPASQSYEFYNALNRRGKTTELVIYPGEGHGIGQPKFMCDALNRTLAWFDRYVMEKKDVIDEKCTD